MSRSVSEIWQQHSHLAHIPERLTLWRMGNAITVRSPEELRRCLEDQSRPTGLSEGRIAREHLKLSRLREARQPFLDLAGSIEADRERCRDGLASSLIADASVTTNL